jgi:hypothetical protein
MTLSVEYSVQFKNYFLLNIIIEWLLI